MSWEFFISYEHLIDLGIAIVIFLGFLVLRRLFTKYIINFILYLSKKSDNKLIPNVLNSFDKPLQWFFIIIGLYFALAYYPYFDHQLPIIFKWLKSIFVKPKGEKGV